MVKAIIIAIIVIAAVMGGSFLLRQRGEEAALQSPSPTPVATPTPTPLPTQVSDGNLGEQATPIPSPTPTPSGPKTHTVNILDSGFEPSQLTIMKGDIVRFISKGSDPHWPASGIHPTHQICPGFDALRGLKTNETYQFTFTDVKECPMHDHLNPGLKGKIIVQ
jgi:plastocyanin